MLFSFAFCAYGNEAFAPINALHPISAQRNALGEPGPSYWQQKVDYVIAVKLLPTQHIAEAQGSMTYHNRSPFSLNKIWLDNSAASFNPATRASYWRQSSDRADDVSAIQDVQTELRQSGIHALTVSDENGVIVAQQAHDNRTAVSLAKPLLPGQSIKLKLTWRFHFIDRLHPSRPRFGFERFNSQQVSFAVAEWYPRPLAISDYAGLHTTPFLGNAEFASELGDFEVSVIAPSDFVVLASGALAPKSSETHLEFDANKCTTLPATSVDVVMKKTTGATRQWQFSAKNIRDFAWVASNALRWQRSCLQVDKQQVLINILFRDGDQLWSRYAMLAAQHGVSELGAYFGHFPFSQMNMINIAGIGMEHPSLSFVGFRQQHFSDHGSQPAYTRTEKYDVIAGILHEVAHSYFPMSVNSDESQEGFLDEGLTSWLSFYLEQSWGRQFQSFYGEAEWAAEALSAQVPAAISSSDNHSQKLSAQYHVPAAAFNLLRETVLNRKLFDQTLKHFYWTWKDKRATFSDLQRFYNSQTGIDLAWFWRSWFYSPKPLQLRLLSAKWLSINHQTTQSVLQAEGPFLEHQTLTTLRNTARPTLEEILPSIQDRYSNDPHFVPHRIDLTSSSNKSLAEKPVLRITIENVNEQVSPVPLRLQWRDGCARDVQLPVDIWRRSAKQVYVFISVDDPSSLVSLSIDPLYQLPLSNRQQLSASEPFAQSDINN